MPYFTFTNKPQIDRVRRLKAILIEAHGLAVEIQRQNTQMTLTDMQNQFGVPAELTEAAWETTVNDVVTALESTAVQNMIAKVGFSV